MHDLCGADVSECEQANTLIAVCGSVRASRTQSHLTDLLVEKDTHKHHHSSVLSFDYSFGYRTHALLSE